MSKVVLWRRAENASTLLVSFLATAISFASITRADSTETSAPNAMPTPQSCQEEFLLGRRDNAQLALQKLRRCNAIYNTSLNVEEFTFWYVTLPSKSASQQNAWFGNIWRNNLQVLTAAPISVPKEEATGVLDAGIARGLKRAKREDLGPKWLASHDPAIIAEAASSGLSAQTQGEHAQRSNTRMAHPPQSGQPASDKRLADSPPIDRASRPATYAPAGRPRRVTPGFQTRYAGPNSFSRDWYDVRQEDALIDELNRAQLQDNAQHALGGALYGPPPPQPYIAFSAQPASSFASGTVQQVAYPSSFQQQPGFATSSPQQPPYAIAQPQASYTFSSQAAAYLPLPLQIEANVRSMLRQFATSVNTLEQAISRQLRGY